MTKMGRKAALAALLVGGLAVIAPTFLTGTTRLGGYGSLSGGYGGMMGGYGGMMGGYGGMMGGYGGMGGFGATSPLVGILGQLGFLLVLIGGGYLLYLALADDSGAGLTGASDPAMTELRVAYARGDLSDEQFESRRKRLQQDGEL